MKTLLKHTVALITILLTILLSSGECLYGQVAKPELLSNQELIPKINLLSLYDYSKAEKLLKSLEKNKSFKIIPSTRIKLGLVKIRLFASTGDFVRVKFELNRLRKLRMVSEIESEDLNTFYVYDLLYGSKELSNYEDQLQQIVKEGEKYSAFCRLLVSCKLASIYSEEGRNVALKNMEKVTEDIVREMDCDPAKFYSRTGYGQFYFLVNNIAKSQQYFEETKKIAREKNWKCALQLANLNLGETYLYSNELEKAKKYFDTVVLHKEVTELRDLYQVYGCLEYYYQLKGNLDSSYYFLGLRNEIDDQLEDMKSTNLVGQLDDLFEEEIDMYKYQLEIKKNQRLKAILSIVLLGIIIISIIIFYIISHIRRTNRILKRQKSQIESNLLLKEKLIKEIHHRVKNNLQIVSSILNLQSKNINDQKALQIIEEGKERIQAIALIHNQLHLSKETAFVEMDTYLLQFIEQIKHSFLAIDKDVSFNLEIENMKMSIDNAVPLGMIFCELLSNSYKHGFKERSNGKIQISMHLVPNGKSHLIDINYADDGVGYTGEKPFLEQDSTGVEIIQAFVEQLDAEFTLDTNHEGFKIRLRFEPAKLGK